MNANTTEECYFPRRRIRGPNSFIIYATAMAVPAGQHEG